MQPRLLVGLVNWNECEQTFRCVDAIRQSAGVELEFVVVDNGSAGDDAGRLRGRLGAERVIETGENRGYAGGMNAVLKYALSRPDVERVLLMTPDCILEPGALPRMLEVLERDGVGAVGPVVVYSDGPHGRVGAGGVIEPRRARSYLLNAARGSDPYPTDWIDGCCMLLRREAVAAVDGFDERFFIYFEETDFCVRLRGAGWAIWVAPSALARHPKGHAVPPAYYFYYMARNRYLFWGKNFQVRPGRVAAGLVRGLAGVGVWVIRSRGPLPLSQRLVWMRRSLSGTLRGSVDFARQRFGRMPARQ